MKRIIYGLACLLLILLLSVRSTYGSVQISGKAAVMIDQNSGRILYEKNAHEPLLIASTVKVMTALLAIESGRLYDLVEIDDNVLNAYGSGIYVSVGEEILLIDLVYGLMLRSGNDAALAIANFVSGSEEKFVELMNQRAEELELKDVIFTNPHGLDEKNQNKVSAYNLALIYKEAMNNEVFREISSTKEYTVKTDQKTYVWNNKNKLLRTYEYSTGGKTGFTKKAGRTLVTSAKKDELELIVVTLNNGNDFSDHKKMFEYGFKKYIAHEVINPRRLKVPKNKYSGKDLFIREAFVYPLTEDELDLVTTKIKLYKPKDVIGPKVGYVNIYKDDEKIGSIDIYKRKKDNP